MLAGQCFIHLHHLFLATILQGKYHDTLCKKATLVTCERVYTTEGQMRRMTTKLALWTTPAHLPSVVCCGETQEATVHYYEEFLRKITRWPIMRPKRTAGVNMQFSHRDLLRRHVSAAMFWTQWSQDRPSVIMLFNGSSSGDKISGFKMFF